MQNTLQFKSYLKISAYPFEKRLTILCAQLLDST